MNAAPYYASEGVTLHLGDCLNVLPTLADASVDAIVCDPPYALRDLPQTLIMEALTEWLTGNRAYIPGGKGFMGRDWDRFVPPPAAWDACWRVLKPGAHLLAFAAPRTADLMGMSIRLAGFEIRDSLHWIYGSGFPKGQDIAKGIDKRRDDRDKALQVTAFLAAARDAAGWTNQQIDALWGFNGMAGHWTTQGKAASVPTPEQWDRLRESLGFDDTEIRPLVAELNARRGTLGEAWAQRQVIGQGHRVRRESDVQIAALSAGAYDLTAPATDAAQRWQGWNTALKPAHEPIVLARKSTGFNTTVANVLAHGTGALNIDGCRTNNPGPHAQRGRRTFNGFSEDREVYGDGLNAQKSPENPAGRWPTNILLGHGPDCVDGGACQSGCPVAEMDRQSGVSLSRGGSRGQGGGRGAYSVIGAQPDVKPGFGDTGGASRFFSVFRYEAKAPASERPRLADGTAHTTVKPLALMQWLVRLVTPPGGTVLDPFTGSGTTLAAVLREGMTAIGIEQHEPYAQLAVQRLSEPYMVGLFGDLPA